MDIVSTLLDFANIINLIAVLLLMRAIIKDRKVLKGFSVSGTFLTFVAIFCFETVYLLMGEFRKCRIRMVNLVFWLMAFVFSLRKLLHEHRGK